MIDLTWNDLLDIKLRNKDNPDVDRLLEELRALNHPAFRAYPGDPDEDENE